MVSFAGRHGRLAAAVLLLTAFGGLLVLGDLGAGLEVALLLLGLGFLALPLALPGLRDRRDAARWILTIGALARLLALPLEPTLSDDLLRYLWDGRVVAAGHNPYALAPAAEELAPLRDGLWERLPHREVPTVYPPLALGAFALAASSPLPAPVLKALLASADLVACWLLLIIARRLALPLERVALYAWNPLVILEVAGMGHVDALGVAGAVGAVAALLTRRPRAAGVAAALGVLGKLGPLVALPAWSRWAHRSGHARRLLTAVAAVLAVGLFPVLLGTGGVPQGLLIYGVSWEFNGPLYEPLWRLADALAVDRWLASGVDLLKAATDHHSAWNRIYPFLYPQLVAKGLLAAGMLTLLLLAGRRGRLVGTTGALFGGFILLSATVYPWYLLWVLPWAALAGHRAWLGLCPLILLSYLPQFREVALWPGIFLLIWVPFAVLFLLERRRWSTV